MLHQSYFHRTGYPRNTQEQNTEQQGRISINQMIKLSTSLATSCKQNTKHSKPNTDRNSTKHKKSTN
jgi:hypothetical protein